MQSGKVLDQSLERYTEAVFRTCSLEKENTREFWEISKNTFFYKTPLRWLLVVVTFSGLWKNILF